MNQENIGIFISELRKELGMTQQQLADAIGVSNKTISKWECGKGMPEMSSIMPLCQTLHINVNEFLSGERLPADGYSKKAEENMMNLIQETENNKKKIKTSQSLLVVTVFTLLLGGILTIVTNGGIGMSTMLFDLPTLLPMLIVTLLYLLGTHLGYPFLQAFVIVTGKKQTVLRSELIQAQSAIRLVSHTLLGMGIFECCVGFIAIFNANLSPSRLYASIPIALLGILYGFIGFLALLPFQIKLNSLQHVQE